jgi:hypothetical protein
MQSGKRALCVLIVLCAFSQHITAQSRAPEEDRVIEIILLRDAYSVRGVRIDNLQDVLALVAQTRPAVVRVGVCRLASNEAVSAFRNELANVYKGNLEVQALPPRALECGWNDARTQSGDT